MKFRAGDIVRIKNNLFPSYMYEQKEIGELAIVVDVNFRDNLYVKIPSIDSGIAWMEPENFELVSDDIEIFKFLRENNIGIKIDFPTHNEDINNKFVDYFSKLIV